MIKIGNTEISKIYLGSTEVPKAYLGSVEVYGTGPQPIDYSKEYLTYEMLANGTIKFSHSGGAQYSLNDGEWTAFPNAVVSFSEGDKVRIKNEKTTYSYTYITVSGNCLIYGNIMSVFYGDNFENQTTLPGVPIKFSGGAYIQSVENLVLPATTLVINCYESMFAELTSITNTPELPALTLQANCYRNMFNGCTSLTRPPALPATTLAENCYENMFQNCTSLTTAPDLLCPTYAITCYRQMFQGCTNLNHIKCLLNSYSSMLSKVCNTWVDGVSASGTFVKTTGVNWPSGTSGIPDGWTVVDAT